MGGISCPSSCLSHSAVMASLSVIKGTFQSDEPIKRASIVYEPHCLSSPSPVLALFGLPYQVQIVASELQISPDTFYRAWEQQTIHKSHTKVMHSWK